MAHILKKLRKYLPTHITYDSYFGVQMCFLQITNRTISDFQISVKLGYEHPAFPPNYNQTFKCNSRCLICLQILLGLGHRLVVVFALIPALTIKDSTKLVNPL